MKIEEIYSRCAQTGAWHGVEISHFSQRNFMEDTVLHTVCSWGDLEAVKILVAAGADVNAKGDLGGIPLFNAVVGRNPDVVQFLLKSGCNPKIANSHKRLVLDYAKSVSAPSLIIQLLENATTKKRGKR